MARDKETDGNGQRMAETEEYIGLLRGGGMEVGAGEMREIETKTFYSFICPTAPRF